MHEFILSVLLSLAPAYTDNETWEERVVRMGVVAEAIDNATAKATCTGRHAVDGCSRQWAPSPKSLAMLLVTKGWWESKFAKNVHEGKCKAWECDAITQPDGSVVHKARSPWQVQQTGFVSPAEWTQMLGAERVPTAIAALVAMRNLASGFRRCRTIHGAMAAYGGVSSCTWNGVTSRHAWWKALMAKTPEELEKSAALRRDRLTL